MEDPKLSRVLQARPVDGDPTLRCPDEHVLAAIAQGQWPKRDADKLREHISACDWCLAAITDVARAEALADESPDAATARAAHALYAEHHQTPKRWQKATRWASAAVLALAVSLGWQQWAGFRAPDIESDPVRNVRSIGADAMRPDIVFPEEGDYVVPGTGEVNWSPVAGSLYYDVRVVDAEGALIQQTRVERTRWIVPADLVLTPGSEYFVRVDAYLAEAKRVSSRHVAFIAGDGG